ncbi:GNAT family N-acetyltransferase [Ulvibacter litoralis]|uniref:Protein N-acetyltransferase, RimJ/RimL family n=1 Tax=Ulvibacter litoralis TaxID=227084 RepID=A0A1G7I068_9FLAO|nr:GNAT family protein [Ulvibacter litoralis]GHC62976.1 GCN5 family acetyltransferase [Ulvibacter litoralis]SDF05856.1 Protein N-acetyltransferase, RimJ/RimL family [Ulvibacter litoralis]
MEILNFSKDYVLENDVVLLRPLATTDFKHLSSFSIHEPQLWKYSLVQASGLENLKKYIALALQAREDKTSYPFIVFDKRTQKYAGSTRFYDYQPHHNTVQLGYTWYGSEFHGTGLNKNCKFLLLQFAFETLKVERVEFRADATNQRSIAAMKSIGCTVEGILRKNCASLTGRRDSIILSILQNEWFQTAKTSLSEKIKKSNPF